MIIPLSGHSTERMGPLVENYYDACSLLHIMNISGDANPSTLFEGVKFRLAIALTIPQGEERRSYSTKYTKWFADERSFLFQQINYIPNGCRPNDVIPKFATNQHRDVIWTLLALPTTLGRYTQGDEVTYYHNTPVSWIRSHSFVPYFHSERDGTKQSTQLKSLRFENRKTALAASGILSSTLFFLWWIAVSDCYHLNKREIETFPVNLSDSALLDELPALSDGLSHDLKKNSKKRVYQYRTSGRVEYDEYYPKLSKPIIDDIDRVLAKHYGFTDEELDYIINYDIKYRMGRDGLNASV